MTLFVAILRDPNVQTKAQDELDTVIGRERLPTFEDRPGLPYINAICREILRWRPVVPLGTSNPSLRNRSVYMVAHSHTPFCETRRRI